MTHQILLHRSTLALVLCLVAPISSLAKLSVVTTTADFGAIAREIGAELVQVTVLANAMEDPHFVDPKPSYITRLFRADVLIEGGAELESGWLPPLLEGARNARLAAGQAGHVACAEGLVLLEVPTVLDRSKGDLHALGNPHYMTDPANGRHAAQRICSAFIAVDREHADVYRQRLDAFAQRLDERLGVWQKQLEPFKGRRIVAFHNSWPYFARRFGVRIDLFLEPKPGIPPTPAHLAEVVATMKGEKIGVILVEPYQSRKTAEAVSTKTGATVLAFSQYPGGIKGTEAGYMEWMDGLVTTLSTAMNRAVAPREQKP
jgi:zinc/manganese transport system substrate-binding protein